MQRIKLHAREPHFLGIINVSTYALFAAYTAVATVNTDINPCLIAAEPQPPRRNREGLQCQLTLPRPFHLLLFLDPKRTRQSMNFYFFVPIFLLRRFPKPKLKRSSSSSLRVLSSRPPSFSLPSARRSPFFCFTRHKRAALSHKPNRGKKEKKEPFLLLSLPLAVC